MKVLVIGAGIIGTTSALKIQEAWPECHIDIVTESLSPGTTSDGAAGFWQPHLDPHTPTELARKWSIETFRELEKIWTCPRACPASLKPLSKALSLVPAEEIWNRNCSDAVNARPYWADIVYDYHKMPLEDLSRRGFDTEVFDSHSFTTFVFEAKIALPIIYSLLRERGAAFIEKKLLSIDDLEQLMEEEANYDFVINCSGSGARDLFGDEDIQPIRGHVVRVEAPFVHTMMGLGGDVYIIPTRQGVVLGTIDRLNDWSLEPNPSEVATIMKRCQELCPALADSKILNDWVGLRPFRKSGVRLELVEHHQSTSGRKTKMIHNYGHGGSGITLSLGCANEVVRLVKAQINEKS
ncbi:hypothetical protein TCAL_05776 [Tigriopus californicus]|uniref:FAD dependent oxidoreductase domain-containing protein n=1 Tax=Tigriopus californicus TaxID=6832 RepID=A0A553NCS8_TIGCA|nr:D-aspartate oxidase-like [Tigriopus californicus]TRY63253.1 hypothetical protein TCAL_05776 [Tigriopus californicus]